jgi:abhydrolase domain-containing protein 1/3
MFGYTSNDAYYRASVLRDRLHQIKCCPLVCLNAVDDPFCPAVSLPVAAATKSDNVALVLTDFGGHIGFIEGVSPYGPNFADRLFRQLASNIFSNVSMKE